MAVLQTLISLYLLVLLARMVLSWVPPSSKRGFVGQLDHFTMVLTEPVLAPIRRVVPIVSVGGVGLDLSVLIVFFVLMFVRAIL
jgi:YggT family protein